jgi:N-methylhydantoinase A
MNVPAPTYQILKSLAAEASKAIEGEGVAKSEITTTYQVDLRYHGQGLRLTIAVDLKDLQKRGLKSVSDQFDEEHKRLFTFALPLEHELVTLRAAVQGRGISIKRQMAAKGGSEPKAAAIAKQKSYMEGKDVTATVYDRAKLKAGNKIKGPAIVVEMDSTTVILPKHTGTVDKYGNILIYPDGYKISKGKIPKGKAPKKGKR